jgi:hypothetical protein
MMLKAGSADLEHSSREIYLQTAYGLRKLWPDVFPKDTCYLGMAVLGSGLNLPAAEAVRSSVSHIAIMIRQAYQRLNTPEEMERLLYPWRESIRSQCSMRSWTSS